MKSKWDLISSIIQLVLSILVIIAFIILVVNKEFMTKWIITLLFSTSFITIEIIRIIDYKSNK